MILKMAVALLGGGLTYSAWLVLFLSTFTLDGLLWQATLWLLAPIVTAVGFAAGAAIHERCVGVIPASFRELFAWSFVGCAVGALAVVWFGPMLIVFAMLVAGTAAIGLRDFMALRGDTGTG